MQLSDSILCLEPKSAQNLYIEIPVSTNLCISHIEMPEKWQNFTVRSKIYSQIISVVEVNVWLNHWCISCTASIAKWTPPHLHTHTQTVVVTVAKVTCINSGVVWPAADIGPSQETVLFNHWCKMLTLPHPCSSMYTFVLGRFNSASLYCHCCNQNCL